MAPAKVRPAPAPLRFRALGTALPDKVVTNRDLEGWLDTSDAWITERSGIRERRVGGTTAGLATAAGRAALEAGGIDPASVDLLILATTTPDRAVPATASRVQRDLGLTCGAFDLNAACSGWVYGLVAAEGFLRAGLRRILVIGSETLSRIVNWEDRGTAVLFADGAGAALVESGDTGALLGWDLGSDGEAEDLLYCDHGDTIRMEGREVFRRAVRVMVAGSEAAMERAGVTAADIALVVPHQANIRIIDAACQRLGIPSERTAVVLDRTGNTSSASVPLALADAVRSGRLTDGDHVLFCGFGAGMTWAAAVVRWEGPALTGPEVLG